MGFSYHANTLAFGGQIDQRGRTRRLPSQASVTLPLEGGFGEALVSDYCEAGVSFYRAESRVYGNSFRNKLFKTFANVTVYGLDLEGRVQADVLSASIISINERVNNCPGESRISFDATIVGLVIDGHPYDVELNGQPFRDHGTFSAFTDSITKMSVSELEEVAKIYNWEPKDWQAGGRVQVPAHCQQAIRASIVSKITPSLTGDYPKLRQQGFTIEVPNFGLLHLGEVMLTIGKRGINLLRVELGRTLEDLVAIDRLESLEEVADESLSDTPQSTVVQFAPMQLDSANLIDGGYTVANVSGNGTDFGPPP
jgi:hypothetical protein